MILRVLIIARHYPPAVSGGARRPALLAAELRKMGHKVWVVAPKLGNAELGVAVAHPAEAVPRIGIVRPPVKRDPFYRRWQRSLLLWPDADRFWANRILRLHRSGLRDFAPDVVVTTSPPESSHAVGVALKRDLGCVWMADLRDSWLADPLVSTRQKVWRRAVERVIAKRWLRQADLLTAPTAFILNEVRQLAPRVAMHLFPQISEAASSRPESAPDIPGWDDLPEGAIRVLHSGSFALSDSRREIARVINAFECDAPAEAFLCLAGRLTEEEYARVENAPRLRWLGVLTRDTVLGLQAEADALLLVAADGATAVPGKLAEYRAAGRPIVAVGEGPWRREAEFSDINDSGTQSSMLPGFVDLKRAREREPAEPTLNPSLEVQRLVDCLESILKKRANR